MRLPEFSAYEPARLIRARPAAAEQAFLRIEPPAGFLEAHTWPGQFCQIRLNDASGIFALLSSPGEAPCFLVRIGGPEGSAADALAALDDGSPVEVSQPAGDGFGLERARGRDVRFVATGTGVAPVCAAIDHVLRERDAYGEISLDYGVKSAAHVAIGPSIERWRDAGVDVRIAYSRIDETGGLVGSSVQDSLRAAVRDLAGAAIVCAGQQEMLASLREIVAELGGDPDGLLTNV